MIKTGENVRRGLHALVNSSAVGRRTQMLRLLSSISSAVVNIASACKYLC